MSKIPPIYSDFFDLTYRSQGGALFMAARDRSSLKCVIHPEGTGLVDFIDSRQGQRHRVSRDYAFRVLRACESVEEVFEYLRQHNEQPVGGGSL